MEQIQKQNLPSKPKILIHACCIVCACWPLEFLHDTFDITIMYNNSNIWPKEEYDLRLAELRRYIKERWNDEIPVIVTPYDYDTYSKTILKNRAIDPEGWKSCFGCYAERMNEAFAYADQNHFDYFTTVMTFSRQKDSEKINQIGLNIGKQYSYTKYFCTDFKKGNGQKHSDEICDEYCIYRQDYCGCEISFKERHS